MVGVRTQGHDVVMAAERRRPMLVAPFRHDGSTGDLLAVGRDPAHELCEQAAGLLASAGALRAAAHAPGTATAIGATLACLEASLDALADVADRLRNQAVQPDLERDPERAEAGHVGSEVERRFRHLILTLEDSRAACAYARVAVGPVQSCARHALRERV
jgi:hypothetical protein